MAKTIEQLKAQGAEVKNATVVGENTATRVGTLFTDIVEHVEQYEAGQTADTEANTIAISNEAQVRAKADEQLNTAIEAEKNRAEVAEEVNAQAINTLKNKTSEITKEVIKTEEDFISIEDNNGNEVCHLDENGLDAKNVKSNGKDVLTEQNLSTLATKEEVEKAKVKEITSETTEDSDSAVLITTDDDKPVTEVHAELTDDEEEAQTWTSDDYNGKGRGEQYAKISSKGITAKGFFDFDGNNLFPIKLGIDNRILSESENNPIAIIKETPGLTAILNSWGFIGDSLSSGYPNNYLFDQNGSAYKKDEEHFIGGSVNFYKYSWGQMMCRLMGAFGSNYSNGGQTTFGWLDRYPNNTVATYNTDGTKNVRFSSTKHNAYAIMLGTNDAGNSFPSGNVNSDVDVSNYNNNNLSTYAGCYAKIISLCKEVAPSSKIFAITCPLFESPVPEPTYNNVVRDIVAKFTQYAVSMGNHTNIFLVDLAKYVPNKEALKYMYGAGHCHTQGYMYFAYAFMTYVDYIIRNNPLSFSSVYAMDTAIFDNGKL